MKAILASISVLSAAAVLAAPQAVKSVTWSQDVATHVVTVTYSLDATAIVTAEMVTNGVVVSPVSRVAGDLNRRLDAGPHSFRWSLDRERGELGDLPADAVLRLKAWDPTDPPDYMLVSLVVPGSVLYFESVEALPFGIDSNRYRQDDLLLRRIHASNVRWRMGCAPDELGANATQGILEVPHYVTLTRDYYIGTFAVTQHQWYRLMAGDQPYPAKYRGCPDCRAVRPVEQVNVNDIRGTDLTQANWPNADEAVARAVRANSYLDRLRTVTGLRFDLPTEAQWEFACRAGTTTAFYNGREIEYNMTTWSSTNLMPIARFAWNGGTTGKDFAATHWEVGATARVGAYEPNAWGLYDMLGNVREWVLGWGSDQTSAEETDPTGPAFSDSNKGLVYKGGGLDNQPRECRSAWRQTADPTSRWNSIGFRVALEVKPGVGPIVVEEE